MTRGTIPVTNQLPRIRPALPEGEGKLSYQYDPENPVPTIGGQNLIISKGPMDQRPVESRPDVMLFDSEPLSEPLEVTGRITAKLFISSDCPDTDFTVSRGTTNTVHLSNKHASRIVLPIYTEGNIASSEEASN